MKLTKCFFLALAGLFLSLNFASLAVGQTGQKGIPSDGRDFYFAYKRTSFDCTSVQPYQSYWILISSYYDCHATISYFDEQTGEEVQDKKVAIVAKTSQQIPINTDHTELNNTDGEIPEYTAIHVHADRPINVQYFSTGPDDAEMYLVLPTGALGKKYVVMAAPNNNGTGSPTPARFCNNGGEPSSSFFGIVSIKDGTNVKIRPSGTTRKGFPGATSGPNNGHGAPLEMDVILKRGQVYWVKSDISSNPGMWDIDMTGSQIEADQPVAVIAGCENAYNGDVAANFADMRNMTMEMMVPEEYWASAGYLVVPMFDAGINPNDNSAGDQAKIVVADTAPTGCLITGDLGDLGQRTYSVEQYQFPAASVENILDGAVFSSECGQKFAVEQYDYRGQSQTVPRTGPFTAPNQMNVVPASRFRTSFMWTVPTDPRQVSAHRYINVICRTDQISKIKVYRNGLPLGSMSNVGSSLGATSFPGAEFKSLRGFRYEVPVGCYYATADSAFAVYQYGMSGFDYDHDLGDWDADDFFNAYSAPCGQSFGVDGAYRPTITVDTVCKGGYHWMIHVTDTAKEDMFISTIEILKDHNGVQKRRPDSDTGYTSYNVDFDPIDFTVVPGLLTKDSVKIVVQDPLKDAEAWVWAVNGAGNDTLVHLTYSAPSLLFGAVTSKGPDSLTFKNAPSGTDTCSWFIFKNAGVPTSQSYTITSASVKVGGQGFSVTATDPPLPYNLKPGDSIKISVCFNTTLAGRPLFDTLVVDAGCWLPIAALSGSTTIPEITATDYDFGAVVIGQQACHTVRVSNTGKAPFDLYKTYVIANFGSPDFTLADSAKLPKTLQPNEYIDLTFCFAPSTDQGVDSSVITWQTNIGEPYTTVKKNWSYLKGQGIKPSLTWDRDFQNVAVECDQRDTFRVYLRNYGTAPIRVNKVEFRGATASEWKIIDNKLGLIPLVNFDLNADLTGKHDSIWVDIEYTPDRTNGLIKDDTLIAYDDHSINPLVKLNARISYAAFTASPTSIDLGLVAPGALSGTQTVTIKDTGTAPLIIGSISIDPPFSMIDPSIKIGDTIFPGQTKVITIQGQTTDPTATGNLKIDGITACDLEQTIPVTISTAAIHPEATGASFNATYICQNGVQVVTTTAIGQGYKLVLDSITIQEDPANPGESGDFVFDSTGTQVLTMTDVLQNGDTRTYKVRYTPSTTGTKHARIRYAYHRLDDPSITSVIDTTIIGSGLQEHTILSAAKDPANPTAAFAGKTNDFVTVPINLTQTIRPEALVKTITFDLSFVQDQFDPATGHGAPWLTAASGYTITSQNETDANGIATIHVALESANGVVQNADHVADLTLKVMIARTKSSSFVISNVAFFEAGNTTPLCYVAHDTIPGMFDPTDICGDSTLRQYLITGRLRFSIGDVRPNPASNSVQIGLDIAEDGVPLTVELYNVVGEQLRIFANGQAMAAGHQKMDLNLTGLPEGAYTVRVAAPGQVGSQMILIQR